MVAPSGSSSVLEHAAVAAVTSLGFFLMAAAVNQVWGRRVVLQQLAALQAELAKEAQERAAERAGRVRAEQQLKEARLSLAALHACAAPATAAPAAAAAAADLAGRQQEGAAQEEQPRAAGAAGSPPAPAVFPLQQIGVLRSCFSQRNGTPRQPLLVSAARAYLELCPGLPVSMLEGLEQYSHCWVLYVFHRNTDLAKVLSAQASGGSGFAPGAVKAKVGVPRLNGAKMGVLATRSPHRPVPLGLSVAKVLRVADGVLWLGGLDVVDGSPVLDIKPYVPFADSLPLATAPSWVREEADDEPLAVGRVDVPPAAAASIGAAWLHRQKQLRWQRGQDLRHGHSLALYDSVDEFMELVQQVLQRDIRAVHHRQRLPAPGDPAAAAAAAATAAAAAAATAPVGVGIYHVTLDGVEVTYDFLDAAGNIVVRGAVPPPELS